MNSFTSAAGKLKDYFTGTSRVDNSKDPLSAYSRQTAKLKQPLKSDTQSQQLRALQSDSKKVGDPMNAKAPLGKGWGP